MVSPHSTLHMKQPARLVAPIAPTQSLPSLGRLSTHSTLRVRQNLQSLRRLYFQASISIPSHAALSICKRSVRHTVQDDMIPDSGYASAEDDKDEDGESFSDGDSDRETEVDLLRADPIERTFAIKWVTGFVARSDLWISAGATETECDERAEILEDAVSLLSAFTGNGQEEDVSLTRTFTFPLGVVPSSSIQPKSAIHVELNDAPLSNDDHTSVGLQSWGSCILFAERISLDPSAFSLSLDSPTKKLRILELGAGTGMLSIVAAKILQAYSIHSEIVATDYHPHVLENLSKNVRTNFPFSPPISVETLDWEHPVYDTAPFDEPFDIILAADVIYHPSHAEWIKRVVERLLVPGGVFWLFIPVRTTGRHEGMAETVDALFSNSGPFHSQEAERLEILHHEEVGRQGGVGRADEGAYRLFKIG